MSLFSAVRFSRVITSPDVNGGDAMYANAVGYGDTDFSYDQVCAILKQTERDFGRTADNITLDIDILLYNTNLFKPADWHRTYNRILINELGL